MDILETLGYELKHADKVYWGSLHLCDASCWRRLTADTTLQDYIVMHKPEKAASDSPRAHKKSKQKSPAKEAGKVLGVKAQSQRE